jgi:2EXR family
MNASNNTQPSLPWKEPKFCPLPTTRTSPTFTKTPRRELEEDEPETTPESLAINLSALDISSEPRSEMVDNFPNFPRFPTEIRLQIWEQAILSLPERIIPIREVIGKAGTPAYFTTSRPHSLLASINREAREAVFSTLQPLFLPGGSHTFASVNTEKDIILLCCDDDRVRPEILQRLRTAMGEKRREEHLHLAIQVQYEQNTHRPHYPLRPNPEYEVIAPMTQIFENICHLTIVPVALVKLDGVERHRGELYLGDKAEFEGTLKEFYSYNNAEYVRKGPLYMIFDTAKNQMVMGPQPPEIRWGCLRCVGGEMFREWHPVRKGYWRAKREEDQRPN